MNTTEEPNLFSYLTPEPIRFDGPAYESERDDERLTGQVLRIFNCMKDGKWRTLAEIEQITHDPQASISAQLRHLRKKRFGEHEVNRRSLGRGLFTYQLIVREIR